MKATAVVDVLSHWCLAAWPAYEALKEKLGSSNARWGCTERPSWRLENANGDFVVMQGVWHASALTACSDALMSDEAAYAAAGTPPG